MIRGGFFFLLEPKLVDPEFDDPEQCCFHEFSTFPCFKDECRNTDPDWYLERDAIWAANENIEKVRTDHNMRCHANFYEELVLQEIYRCSKATFKQKEFLLRQISSFDAMLSGLLYGHNYIDAIKYLSRFAARAKVWLGRADGFWSEGRKTFYEGCVEVAQILLMKQHEAIENIVEVLEGTDEWFKSHRIVNEWIKNVPRTGETDDINSPPISHLNIEEDDMVMDDVDVWDSVSLRIQTQQEERVKIEEAACEHVEDEIDWKGSDKDENKEDENCVKVKYESESISSKAGFKSHPLPSLQIKGPERRTLI